MNTLDISEIKRCLPHRYPFLLLDRVLDYKPFEYLEAIKNVTVNEPFFNGHFPHYPAFPGVLTLESMSQASAVLASKSMTRELEEDTVYLFAGVHNARFLREVGPGDQLHIRTCVTRTLKGFWKCTCVAQVDNQKTCTAELLFTSKKINTPGRA